MKYFISGYGREQDENLALYDNENRIWSAKMPNPSYLHHIGNLLFAVGEFDDHCTITSFIWDMAGCKKIDEIRLEGTALCHLDTDPDRQLLAASCWGNGLFFVVSYTADGHFGKIVHKEFQNDGTDAVSRVHCARFLNDLIFVINIELDRIFTYKISGSGDGAKLTEVSCLVLPKGTGPRHIEMDTDRGLMYCMTEYSSQLLTLRMNDDGSLTMVSTLSTLGPDFKGRSDGSSLALTADRRFLYTANRGENTIARFALDKDGMPAPAGRFSCRGNWPRHIALMDNDTVLAVANQFSGDLAVFPRDPKTGDLGEPMWQFAESGVSFVAEI